MLGKDNRHLRSNGKLALLLEVGINRDPAGTATVFEHQGTTDRPTQKWCLFGGRLGRGWICIRDSVLSICFRSPTIIISNVMSNFVHDGVELQGSGNSRVQGEPCSGSHYCSVRCCRCCFDELPQNWSTLGLPLIFFTEKTCTPWTISMVAFEYLPS